MKQPLSSWPPETVPMAERNAAEQSPDISETDIAEADSVRTDFAQDDFAQVDFGKLDFAQIVRRHQAMVFSIALHFLADRSSAEELAQDVFLQLHANLSTMKSEDHMKFWLRKVTAHRCIDYRRRRKPPQVSLDDAPEPAAPAQSADLFLARRLRQYVAALPEKPRLVMILRYQEDMRAEDIAGILAMPLATVKSHLQRSLALLREKVTRDIGDVTV